MSHKTTQTSQQDYELERKLEELQEYTGAGTQLVSVYIPPDMLISDVRNHIRTEKSEAQNIKSKQTRKNVTQALSSIDSQLKYYSTYPPEDGLVIFSGVTATADEREPSMETIVIDNLPTPIESFTYYCGSNFLTDPLEEMHLAGDALYGLIVLDRRDAQIGLLSGSHISKEADVSSRVPGKHTAGGQSQARFERIRQEAIDNFYQKVARLAENVFYDKRHDLEGILIGGPSPTTEEFKSREYLHHELQNNILGVFDVSDTTERGLYALVEQGDDAIQSSKISHQRGVVDEFYKSLKEKDSAVYGWDEVYTYIDMGAVETVLLSTNVREVAFQMECVNNHTTISFMEEDGICRRCDNEIVNVETKDSVEVVTEKAENRGTNVEFISSKFDGGKQLQDVFGGVAGILRYDPF